MDKLEHHRKSDQLATRPSLLDRPQTFGILPTMWFWNDWERQRLLMPLILTVSLPLGPLVFFAIVALGFSSWVWIAFLVVYPCLLMGLVERKVRAALRHRSIDDAVVPQDDVPRGQGRRVAPIFGIILSVSGIAFASGASPTILLALVIAATVSCGFLVVPVARARIQRLSSKEPLPITPCEDPSRSRERLP